LDFIEFADYFVLNNVFSVHAWVYALGSGDDMTLFSKDRNGNPDANNHEFINFGVNENLRFEVGLAPHDTSVGYATRLADKSMSVNSWTYVVFIMSVVDSKNTQVTIECNEDGVIETETWNNTIFEDKSNYEAFIGIQSNSSEAPSKSNPWYGYIYEFHIHQSAGKSYRLTTGCDGCTDCPLSSECPWDVTWT